MAMSQSDHHPSAGASISETKSSMMNDDYDDNAVSKLSKVY